MRARTHATIASETGAPTADARKIITVSGAVGAAVVWRHSRAFRVPGRTHPTSHPGPKSPPICYRCERINKIITPPNLCAMTQKPTRQIGHSAYVGLHGIRIRIIARLRDGNREPRRRFMHTIRNIVWPRLQPALSHDNRATLVRAYFRV